MATKSTSQTVVIIPSEEFISELAQEVANLVLSRMQEQPIKVVEPDGFLTIKQAAQLLNISTPTLRKLRQEGKIKTYGEGTHHIRFKRSEIEAAMANM